ncbi:MAG: DNA-directed RNA polymerase subunit beta [Sporolactobacillus sp.]|jgi:hypothetical protein|nr:DNA-directed RNA polymerase subunit beta [Sporolactobacillus sp.]
MANNHNQDEHSAARAAEKKAKPSGREKKQEETPLYNPFFAYRPRRFPIWQRLVLLVSMCAVALVGGAMIGYGLIGGGSPWEVFNWQTWQHILDFVEK